MLYNNEVLAVNAVFEVAGERAQLEMDIEDRIGPRANHHGACSRREIISHRTPNADCPRKVP